MKVHDAIIRFLVAENVDTVFTLMSEDVMGMTTKIRAEWDDEIDVIEARHEQGAVEMADGYARACGDLGVCIVGRGPGIAQTGTALQTARKRGSPLLVLTAETPLSAASDYKYFEQESYLRTMVGDVVSVRSQETVVPKFEEVFHGLHTGDGPIAVQVPWDLLDSEATFEFDADGFGRPETSRPRVHPDAAAVERAVDMYLDSDATVPPLILAGRGAVRADAREAIEDLAERTSALLATTVHARSYFSDHPFSVGFTGTFGSTLANEYLSRSDFVLAVGCSLSDDTTDDGRLVDDATVVHVDVDRGAIGRHTPVDLGIVGDARLTTEALAAELDRQGIEFSGKHWTDTVRRRIANTPALDDREFPDAEGRIDPPDLVRALDDVLPAERLVVTDGGHFINWVLDGITIPHPDEYVWSIEFASIGLGLSMGIGAACTTDERTTVAFCGDAGFMMSMQELETATRYDVPIVVVVVNDDALGSEYHQLEGRGEYSEPAIVETPDLAAVAEAIGAEGHTVRSVDDLDDIGDVLAGRPDGPVVVDCKVNREVRHRYYDSVG